MGQGLADEALAAYAVALAEAEAGEDKVVVARILETVGLQNYLAGRFDAARDALGKALAIYHESAGELRAVNALQQLCRVWVADGELDRATDQLLQAISLEAEGQERWVADGHHVLAEIYALRSQWSEARASAELALSTRLKVDDRCGLVESLTLLGFIEQQSGDWVAVARCYDEAVAVSELMDPAACRVLALRHRGRLHLRHGDIALATADLDRATAIAESIPDTLEYAPALLASAELMAARGELGEGLRLAELALERARTVEQVAEAELLLCELNLRFGDPVAAASHARGALIQAQTLAAPRLLALAELATTRSAAARASG